MKQTYLATLFVVRSHPSSECHPLSPQLGEGDGNCEIKSLPVFNTQTAGLGLPLLQ